MKINFSCRSLYRHSSWNFHFFSSSVALPPTLFERQPKEKKKSRNNIFVPGSASATAEKFFADQKRCFSFLWVITNILSHLCCRGDEFNVLLVTLSGCVNGTEVEILKKIRNYLAEMECWWATVYSQRFHNLKFVHRGLQFVGWLRFSVIHCGL